MNGQETWAGYLKTSQKVRFCVYYTCMQYTRSNIRVNIMSLLKILLNLYTLNNQQLHEVNLT